MVNDLPDVCEKLQRDAGARKVMMCSSDGEILAHAGLTGTLDDAAGDAIAQLLADVVREAAANPATPTEDIVITLRGTLQACATPVGTRGALVVVFDGSTSLDRIRQKMRRARTSLEKAEPNPAAADPSKAKGSREPS